MNINLHLSFFWDNLTLHLVILGNANYINSAARLQGDLHCIPWKWEIHFSSFIFIKRKILLFKPFDKKQLRIPGILIREQSRNHPKVLPFPPQLFCLPPLPPSRSAHLHNVIKRAVIITAAHEGCAALHAPRRRQQCCPAHFPDMWAPGVLALSQLHLQGPQASSPRIWGHTRPPPTPMELLLSQIIPRPHQGAALLPGTVVPGRFCPPEPQPLLIQSHKILNTARETRFHVEISGQRLKSFAKHLFF